MRTGDREQAAAVINHEKNIEEEKKLQKLEDALRETGETGDTWEKGETGGTGDTGLTGSTVLRHEFKPKMDEIS